MSQGNKAKFNFQLLADNMRAKRGDRKVRDILEEVGLPLATYSRLENAQKKPDYENLCIVCAWLGDHPGRYFISDSGNTDFTLSIDLRAAKDMTPEEAQAFAELIRTTYNQILSEDDNDEDEDNEEE